MILEIIKKSYSDYNKIKKKKSLKKLIIKAKKLKSKKDISDFIKLEFSKREENLHKKEIEIYNKIRHEKILKKEIVQLKGIDLDLTKPSKINVFLSNFSFGLIKTKIRSLIFYMSNDRIIDIIGLNKKYETLITLFKNETYIKNDSDDIKPFFHKNKNVIFCNSDFPMNFDIDVKKGNILVDAKGFHNLINFVFRYKLTVPLDEKTSVFSWIRKNWIIILLGVALYIAYTQGGLEGAFG